MNIQKELKKMQKHLENATDDSLIRGYKEAKADYENTGEQEISIVCDLIKAELDKRGVNID